MFNNFLIAVFLAKLLVPVSEINPLPLLLPPAISAHNMTVLTPIAVVITEQVPSFMMDIL